MKLLAASMLVLSIAVPALAQDSRGNARAVAPALDKYSRDVLDGSLWRRPDLSPRDRSIVTLSVLIARNQGIALPRYLNRALDNGVTPREISEIITHLAFYSGWGDAMAAVAVARKVFAARGIGASQLPPASPKLLPIDAAAEAIREARVQKSAGPVSPGLVEYTRDVLFNDLWLRPDLAPRDRSLVTVSALIAAGQLEQLPAHLNKGMDNGLTRTQVSEAITQIAFHAGWPRAFSAVTVVAKVFDGRVNSK